MRGEEIGTKTQIEGMPLTVTRPVMVTRRMRYGEARVLDGKYDEYFET